MWKLTTTLTFLEGGCIAEIYGEYTPNVGEYGSYPPKVLRRVFVSRGEGAMWLMEEIDGFNAYTKEVETTFHDPTESSLN